MALSAFLPKHLTLPIGALSTCASDRLPTGHTHIRMKDQPQIEYLPVVGAGGINSSMPDLCKFGNSVLT